MKEMAGGVSPWIYAVIERFRALGVLGRLGESDETLQRGIGLARECGAGLREGDVAGARELLEPLVLALESQWHHLGEHELLQFVLGLVYFVRRPPFLFFLNLKTPK